MICASCNEEREPHRVGRKICAPCARRAHNEYIAKRRATQAEHRSSGVVETVVCTGCGQTKERASFRLKRCRDCVNAYHAEWRAAHPNSVRSAQSKLRIKVRNSEDLAAARREWARGRYRIRPEHFKTKSHNRRAMQAGAAGALSESDWQEILSVFGHRCAYCLEWRADLERDHVIALTRGGSNGPENIVPACRACNARKLNHPVWHMLRSAA